MAATKPNSGKVTSGAKRQLKRPKYKPLHIGKKLKPTKPPLPNVLKLTRQATTLIWNHKRLFLGITLVYGLLDLVLVHGLASHTDVVSLKQNLNQVLTGYFKGLASGLTIFVVLVGSTGSGASQSAGAYQLFLTLIVSLAIIWALRQVTSGLKITVRDAYYRGIYPLVPFIVVLFIIGLQLLPLIIGTGLYSIVTTNGIAVLVWEKIGWALLAIALTSLSLYWLCSSLFAIYIVTLPNMTPLKALRSARELVRYRRLIVIRKILWLPLVLLVAAVVIMLPIIFWLSLIAQWVFYILTLLVIGVLHSYMYSLYRELIND